MSYFLIFSAHYDRDPGLDDGRLSLNHLTNGTIEVWSARSGSINKQEKEGFHERGGMLPPQYRCVGVPFWKVLVSPIAMPQLKGVEGNFYKINPHEVKTDKGGFRGDFGIHKDANGPGSLGCIVMNADKFNSFEKRMQELKGFTYQQIPLFVQYS
jgi:hypothetical protein